MKTNHFDGYTDKKLSHFMRNYLLVAVLCALLGVAAIAIHFLGFWPTAAIVLMTVSLLGWILTAAIYRELVRRVSRRESRP